MEWTITMHEIITDNAQIYEIPFKARQVVYYTHKKNAHSKVKIYGG